MHGLKIIEYFDQKQLRLVSEDGINWRVTLECLDKVAANVETSIRRIFPDANLLVAAQKPQAPTTQFAIDMRSFHMYIQNQWNNIPSGSQGTIPKSAFEYYWTLLFWRRMCQLRSSRVSVRSSLVEATYQNEFPSCALLDYIYGLGFYQCYQPRVFPQVSESQCSDKCIAYAISRTVMTTKTCLAQLMFDHLQVEPRGSLHLGFYQLGQSSLQLKSAPGYSHCIGPIPVVELDGQLVSISLFNQVHRDMKRIFKRCVPLKESLFGVKEQLNVYTFENFPDPLESHSAYPIPTNSFLYRRTYDVDSSAKMYIIRVENDVCQSSETHHAQHHMVERCFNFSSSSAIDSQIKDLAHHLHNIRLVPPSTFNPFI